MNLGAKLPGPKPLPLVGNALMFIGKPESEFFLFIFYSFVISFCILRNVSKISNP